MSEGVASTHSCALPNIPVWEGIARRLTLLNHLHMETFVHILLVTYMRLSELLALIKKDLVHPLVLLLP